jgi:hypothetical protein
VFGDVTALVGVPHAAPDVDRAIEGLRVLAEANGKVPYAATRQSVEELRRAAPGLTAEDAAAVTAAFAAARFFPADLPYLTVAARLEQELVLPVLVGAKRPLQAAADAQAVADAIRDRLRAAS